MGKRLSIYVLMTVVIGLIILNINGYKEEITPLGNVLSTYFYRQYTDRDQDINYAAHIANVTDYHLKKFYKNFDWEHKGEIIDYVSDRDTTWQLYSQEGRAKPNYLHYWQTLRPVMRQFYERAIPHVKITEPVVHFRCSDAPFVEHPQYHLSKAKTVRWMARELKGRGYNEIIILACNRHQRVKNNRCIDFLKFYEQLFKEEGINVRKQCHGIYQDFAMMVYSPVLVSLNESSFSFMAGISKDPRNYISCNLGREHQGDYLVQNEHDWLMDMTVPLLHKDVATYYDSQAVIAQLND